MINEIFSFPISLNILIPTITASLIATIVPYHWNKQKENFQHKLKIIEESNMMEKNIYDPLHSFLDLLYWKYRTPLLKNDKIVWKMKDKPLDDDEMGLKKGIAHECSKTKRNIDENISNRQNGYLQLYRTNEMKPLIDEQDKLFTEIQTLFFKLSYDPNDAESKEEHLDKIKSNLEELYSLHNKILVLYMKRFRNKYWFARRIDDIKNIRK